MGQPHEEGPRRDGDPVIPAPNRDRLGNLLRNFARDHPDMFAQPGTRADWNLMCSELLGGQQ